MKPSYPANFTIVPNQPPIPLQQYCSGMLFGEVEHMVLRPPVGTPVAVVAPVIKISLFSGSNAPTPGPTSSQNILLQMPRPPIYLGT